jgi:hypothetical protein
MNDAWRGAITSPVLVDIGLRSHVSLLIAAAEAWVTRRRLIGAVGPVSFRV